MATITRTLHEPSRRPITDPITLQVPNPFLGRSQNTPSDTSVRIPHLHHRPTSPHEPKSQAICHPQRIYRTLRSRGIQCFPINKANTRWSHQGNRHNSRNKLLRIGLTLLLSKPRQLPTPRTHECHPLMITLY